MDARRSCEATKPSSRSELIVISNLAASVLPERHEIEYPRPGIQGITMRVYIIVAAATLAFFVTGNAKGTVVDTGADAQKDCELFVGGSYRDNGEARSAGSCEGMLETAMLFAPNLPADVRGCPPAQGSTLESAKVLLQYIHRNPDRVSEAGITLAIEAFRDAWPCQGDDAMAGTKQKKHPKKSN
jgi:hypothetical protein